MKKDILVLSILIMLLVIVLGGCKADDKIKETTEEVTSTPVPVKSLNEAEKPSDDSASKYGEMRGLKPQELIAEMTTGWNLGNTFDAPGNETAWGNPATTQEMIDTIAKAGFDVIRLPITWEPFTGKAPDYKIDEKRLARIKEVIDYAFKNHMYVIINMHHENNWLKPQTEGFDAVDEQFTKMWVQIADYFKDYGDHLLFEGMNEPRIQGGTNEWSGGTDEGRDVLNKLNQAFIK